MKLELWRFFVLLVVAAMSTGGHLGAVTFDVSSTLDMIDIAPGDGWCDANSSPSIVSCTLRAAIMEANARSGPDVVKLAADVYTLSLTGSDETGGDLNAWDYVSD